MTWDWERNNSGAWVSNKDWEKNRVVWLTKRQYKDTGFYKRGGRGTRFGIGQQWQTSSVKSQTVDIFHS